MFFFFNDTATTEIYTLSLHDALPIETTDQRGLPRPFDLGPIANARRGDGADIGAYEQLRCSGGVVNAAGGAVRSEEHTSELQHANISYAVFCLKKKKTHIKRIYRQTL